MFDLLTKSTELRDKLEDNTLYFREQMTAAGLSVRPGTHPIVVSTSTALYPSSSLPCALVSHG